MTNSLRYVRLSALCFLFSVLLLSACSKKKADDDASAHVILQSGTGAVLVVFPHRTDLARNQWMAQVHLDGAFNADTLPRVPYADLESMLVLNVPEGRYDVTAWAWMTKIDNSPRAGGVLKSVDVKRGQVTVLRAADFRVSRTTTSGDLLVKLGFMDWREDNPLHLKDYIAEVIGKTAKG
jgi:hypothetical protein